MKKINNLSFLFRFNIYKIKNFTLTQRKIIQKLIPSIYINIRSFTPTNNINTNISSCNFSQKESNSTLCTMTNSCDSKCIPNENEFVDSIVSFNFSDNPAATPKELIVLDKKITAELLAKGVNPDSAVIEKTKYLADHADIATAVKYHIGKYVNATIPELKQLLTKSQTPEIKATLTRFDIIELADAYRVLQIKMDQFLFQITNFDHSYFSNIISNYLFHPTAYWLDLFISNFFFELLILLFIVLFVLIKTTIVHKSKKNTNISVINNNFGQFTVYVYFISLILFSIYFYSIEFGQYDHTNQIFNFLNIIFPVGFYTNSILVGFHVIFSFFFIIFLLFIIDYCCSLKINNREIILLLFLFLIFTRLLFSAYDLFTLYLCLEGLTYTIYILILLCSDRNIEISQYEHKNIFIKYFIFNGLSSMAILFSITSFFLFGGNLKISHLILTINNLSQQHSGALLFFLLFIFCLGFFFKLMIFPFFYWGVAFYENLPTFLFILLNTFYKIIIFCTFIKLLLKIAFFSQVTVIYSILMYFGFFTFLSGIIGALFTPKIRPFLFYTSINQLGLLFIVLGQLPKMIDSSLLVSIFFYFFIYIFSLLFFLIILYSGRITKVGNMPIEYLKDISCLVYTHPLLTILLSCFLFSFAGIPPFIGFFIKYELLMQLFNYSAVLSVFCIIGSLFSAFYYISLISSMYFNRSIISLSLSTHKDLIFLYTKSEIRTIIPLFFSKSSFIVYTISIFFILFLTFHFILPIILPLFKSAIILFIVA